MRLPPVKWGRITVANATKRRPEALATTNSSLLKMFIAWRKHTDPASHPVKMAVLATGRVDSVSIGRERSAAILRSRNTGRICQAAWKLPNRTPIPRKSRSIWNFFIFFTCFVWVKVCIGAHLALHRDRAPILRMAPPTKPAKAKPKPLAAAFLVVVALVALETWTNSLWPLPERRGFSQ